MRLVRAVVLALMLFALTSNVAAADDNGGTIPICVPYDPGLPADHLPLGALPSPFE